MCESVGVCVCVYMAVVLLVAARKTRYLHDDKATVRNKKKTLWEARTAVRRCGFRRKRASGVGLVVGSGEDTQSHAQGTRTRTRTQKTLSSAALVVITTRYMATYVYVERSVSVSFQRARGDRERNVAHSHAEPQHLLGAESESGRATATEKYVFGCCL